MASFKLATLKQRFESHIEKNAEEKERHNSLREKRKSSYSSGSLITSKQSEKRPHTTEDIKPARSKHLDKKSHSESRNIHESKITTHLKIEGQASNLSEKFKSQLSEEAINKIKKFLETIGLIAYEQSFISKNVDYDLMISFAEVDIEKLGEWLELPEYAKQVLIRKILKLRSDNASPVIKHHTSHRREHNGIKREDSKREKLDIKHDTKLDSPKKNETPKKINLIPQNQGKMKNLILQN